MLLIGHGREKYGVVEEKQERRKHATFSRSNSQHVYVVDRLGGTACV